MKKLLITVFAVAALTACKKHQSPTTNQHQHVSSTGAASTALTEELEHKVGDRVFYSFNSAQLSPEAKATLHKQAEFIKSHKDLNFTVEGHCDQRGTREYNLALGEKRAHSAKHYLVHHGGVHTDKVSTISYGKERPAVEGSTEEAYQQNRRAVTTTK